MIGTRGCLTGPFLEISGQFSPLNPEEIIHVLVRAHSGQIHFAAALRHQRNRRCKSPTARVGGQTAPAPLEPQFEGKTRRAQTWRGTKGYILGGTGRPVEL